MKRKKREKLKEKRKKAESLEERVKILEEALNIDI